MLLWHGRQAPAPAQGEHRAAGRCGAIEEGQLISETAADLTIPQDYAAALERAHEILAAGGLALLPAEGLYGLHARALDPAAVGRLRRAKATPGPRAFILLIATPDHLTAWVSRLPGIAAELVAAAWPGPLTLVLPAAERLPADLCHAGQVALRCPGVRFLRELLLSLPEPLLSTSANRGGETPPAELGQVRAEMREQCDLRIGGGTLSGLGSTVLRPEDDGSLSLLRRGLWDPGPWAGQIRPAAADR